VTDALSAAAEPTRRRILQLLAPQPRTVSEIAADFSVTRSAISQHLLVLESVGLVTAQKVGRQRIYRVDPQGLRELQAEIDRFWTSELDLLAFDARTLNQLRTSPARHPDNPDNPDN
jgi:DNA-binding transcriptional ArsR family regulator